jgi:MFS family permease
VFAVTFTRLCGTMMPFALLMVGEATLGSFSEGAWMVSAYSLGAAVAAPFRGRAMDRRRLPEAMRAPLLAMAALSVTLALACAWGAPLPVLVGFSLLLGVIPAGVAGAYRALMPTFLSPQKLAPAFAIDAVLIEMVWICGPPLVGALSLVHPSLTLGVIALSAALATVANRFMPTREAPPATGPGARLSLGSILRGLPLFVFVGGVMTGVSWGTVDTALPPRMEELGSRAELWGALAALMSVASVVGGLLSASLAQPASTREALWRALLFLALWSVFLLPLGLTEGLLGTAIWLACAGLFLAPLVGLLTYLLQQSLPADRQAEGFAIYGACWSLGIGAGSALTAVLLKHASALAALTLAGAIPLVMVLGAMLRVRPLLRAATGGMPPLKSQAAGAQAAGAQAARRPEPGAGAGTP